MKIKVSKNNLIISELELDPSKEYVIGRSTQCDIVLSEPEISRKHARIFFKDEIWHCEVLSEKGFITTQGHSLSQLSLADKTIFQIGEYILSCIETTSANESTQTFQVNPALSTFDEELQHEDKTNIEQLPLKFVLFREDQNGDPVEEITLNNGPITAGRSDDCEILLQDPKASRKHFSLEKVTDGYLIKDLSSTHGTFVGGQQVFSHQLKSGDRIQVGSEIFLYQEIHSAFDHLPVVKASQENNVTTYGEAPHAVLKIGGNKNRNHKAYFLIAVLVIAVFYNQFANKKSASKITDRQVASVNSQDPTAQLSANQKKFLDDTYNLALSLYTSGKYDLAALEIEKIFQLVPNYKDAKNIEALCQQALELKKQKEEADRLQKEQYDLNEKVSGILAECEQLFNSKQYSKVEDCVGRITEMDPENKKAQWLIDNAQAKLNEIHDSAEARAEAARRHQQAKSIYFKGEKAFKEKNYHQALREFLTITKMNFPDPDGIKSKAQAGIKVSKEKMLTESSMLVKEGRSALDQKDYKTAISNFNKALALYAENKEALELKEKTMSELRIEMKNLYSESVIEEDLGNVESAKKKWKVILDSTFPSDPYYQKAKSKTNKYER